MQIIVTAYYPLPGHELPMIEKLAGGSWLTWQRVRMIAILSGSATLFVLGYLFATASGTVDASGRPLGTDFSNVWSAGHMALHGAAPDAWDWSKQHGVQQATHHDANIPFYGWHYPPPFLLVAALLATLPYVAALLIWQATTLAGVVLLIRRIVPDSRSVLLALGAPVVFVCLGHGHNGFLTGALLGGGLLLLERRPWVAGLLLGCLVYKPQFALLIPPLLLVTANWRAFLGAALSAALLVGATLMIWGWPVWDAFFHSLPLTQKVIIESGAAGWEKIQSPFAMIRMWGGTVEAAYVAQAVATTSSLGLTLWLSRRAAPSVRNAAAAATVLLSTPYVLDYDYVVLGVGAAFLIADGRQRGFLSYEKSLLALVWFAPLIARQLAAATLFPLGQLTAVVVLSLAIRRALLLDAALPDRLRSLSFHRSRGASVR